MEELQLAIDSHFKTISTLVYKIYGTFKPMKMLNLRYTKGNFIAWMHEKNILFLNSECRRCSCLTSQTQKIFTKLGQI